VKVLYVAPNLSQKDLTAADTRLRQIIPRLRNVVDLRVIGFYEDDCPVDDHPLADVVVPKKRIGTVEALTGLFSSWPQAQARYYGLEGRKALAKMEAEFRPDIVHFDTFSCSGLSRETVTSRTVLHVHDAISKKYPGWIKSEPSVLKKFFLRNQEKKTQFAERKLFPNSSMCIVDSKEDCDLLIQETGANVSVVPLGYDESVYTPDGTAQDMSQNAIVFSGSMGGLQSVDAARWLYEKVMPAVWQKIPDMQLYFVGSNPDNKIKEIGNMDDRVHVTGFVDSLATYLRGATVVVCPLQIGSGMKTRAIEALATGCALVTTTVGVLGLPPDSTQAWLEANDADLFASEITKLVQDTGLRTELKRNAANYAASRFTWDSTVKKLVEIYQQIMED
jgi:glycosyltransferase involved in cell wall biosynthesis